MTVIVDYEMGNLGSIQNMLKKLGEKSEVSSDPKVIERAKRLILPGVGGFFKGMDQLEKFGLIEVLKTKAQDKSSHLLGICLGMQLFTDFSEEGDREGLGLIPARTERFKFSESQQKLKVPHIGWNYLKVQKENAFFPSELKADRFYFVHSYYVNCDSQDSSLAKSEYGVEFDSIIKNQNVLGVQFHPEKSHKFGVGFFKRWLKETEGAL